MPNPNNYFKNKFINFEVIDEPSSKIVNDIINNHPHTFILIRMNGCGPCEATVPEWKKMCKIIENKKSKNSEIALINFEKSFLSNLNDVGEVNGFPTIKYINRHKKIIEPYEDSSIKVKNRSSKSFVDWVNSKLSKLTKKGGGIHESAEKISLKQKHSAKAQRHNPDNNISIEQLFKNKQKFKKTKKNKIITKRKSLKKRHKNRSRKYNRK